MKGANARQRNDRLNRALQNFLYACMGAEGEASAKPALAVLTELWRRQVWRDARTVNVIGARRPPAAPIFSPSGDTQQVGAFKRAPGGAEPAFV